MRGWLIGAGIAAVGFFGTLFTIFVIGYTGNDLHKTIACFVGLVIIGMFIVTASAIVLVWKDLT